MFVLLLSGFVHRLLHWNIRMKLRSGWFVFHNLLRFFPKKQSCKLWWNPFDTSSVSTKGSTVIRVRITILNFKGHQGHWAKAPTCKATTWVTMFWYYGAASQRAWRQWSPWPWCSLSPDRDIHVSSINFVCSKHLITQIMMTQTEPCGPHRFYLKGVLQYDETGCELQIMHDKFVCTFIFVCRRYFFMATS